MSSDLLAKSPLPPPPFSSVSFSTIGKTPSLFSRLTSPGTRLERERTETPQLEDSQGIPMDIDDDDAQTSTSIPSLLQRMGMSARATGSVDSDGLSRESQTRTSSATPQSSPSDAHHSADHILDSANDPTSAEKSSVINTPDNPQDQSPSVVDSEHSGLPSTMKTSNHATFVPSSPTIQNASTPQLFFFVTASTSNYPSSAMQPRRTPTPHPRIDDIMSFPAAMEGSRPNPLLKLLHEEHSAWEEALSSKESEEYKMELEEWRMRFRQPSPSDDRGCDDPPDLPNSVEGTSASSSVVEVELSVTVAADADEHFSSSTRSTPKAAPVPSRETSHHEEVDSPEAASQPIVPPKPTDDSLPTPPSSASPTNATFDKPDGQAAPRRMRFVVERKTSGSEMIVQRRPSSNAQTSSSVAEVATRVVSDTRRVFDTVKDSDVATQANQTPGTSVHPSRLSPQYSTSRTESLNSKPHTTTKVTEPHADLRGPEAVTPLHEKPLSRQPSVSSPIISGGKTQAPSIGQVESRDRDTKPMDALSVSGRRQSSPSVKTEDEEQKDAALFTVTTSGQKRKRSDSVAVKEEEASLKKRESTAPKVDILSRISDPRPVKKQKENSVGATVSVKVEEDESAPFPVIQNVAPAVDESDKASSLPPLAARISGLNMHSPPPGATTSSTVMSDRTAPLTQENPGSRSDGGFQQPAVEHEIRGRSPVRMTEGRAPPELAPSQRPSASGSRRDRTRPRREQGIRDHWSPPHSPRFPAERQPPRQPPRRTIRDRSLSPVITRTQGDHCAPRYAPSLTPSPPRYASPPDRYRRSREQYPDEGQPGPSWRGYDGYASPRSDRRRDWSPPFRGRSPASPPPSREDRRPEYVARGRTDGAVFAVHDLSSRVMPPHFGLAEREEVTVPSMSRSAEFVRDVPAMHEQLDRIHHDDRDDQQLARGYVGANGSSLRTSEPTQQPLRSDTSRTDNSQSMFRGDMHDSASLHFSLPPNPNPPPVRQLQRAAWDRNISPTPSLSQLRYPSYAPDPSPEHAGMHIQLREEHFQNARPEQDAAASPTNGISSTLLGRFANVSEPYVDQQNLVTPPLMSRLGDSVMVPVQNRARHQGNKQGPRKGPHVKIDARVPSNLEQRFTASPLSPPFDKVPLAERMMMEAQDSQPRARPQQQQYQQRNNARNPSNFGRHPVDDRDAVPGPPRGANNAPRPSGKQPRRRGPPVANASADLSARLSDIGSIVSPLEYRIN